MNGNPGDGDGIGKGNCNGKEEICTKKGNCEGIFCHVVPKRNISETCQSSCSKTMLYA